MAPSSPVQRSNVHFSGRVQGVGFRAHTEIIAREFDVTGYVRNLPDGRVYLECEGEPDEVESFIRQIRHRLSHFIANVEEEKQSLDKRTHLTFGVRS